MFGKRQQRTRYANHQDAQDMLNAWLDEPRCDSVSSDQIRFGSSKDCLRSGNLAEGDRHGLHCSREKAKPLCFSAIIGQSLR